MGPTFNLIKEKLTNKMKKEMRISFGRVSEDGEREFIYNFYFSIFFLRFTEI